jgi:glutathione reductase (NADPH)
VTSLEQQPRLHRQLERQSAPAELQRVQRQQILDPSPLQGMAFVKNVFGDDADARPVYENVASAVFTAPQLATCGLTEEEAVDACGDLKIFTSSFR